MSPNPQTNNQLGTSDKNKAAQLNGNRLDTLESPQDAIALLKTDHEKVLQLFAQFAAADDDAEKLDIARTICSELTIHTLIEEEIFYPAAREALDADDLLDEAAVEHESAKELIAQIDEGSPEDDKWSAKVKVLSEYTKHHINEEQNELFPAVEASDLDLEELGEEMADRKQELADEFAAEVQDFYDEDR